MKHKTICTQLSEIITANGKLTGCELSYDLNDCFNNVGSPNLVTHTPVDSFMGRTTPIVNSIALAPTTPPEVATIIFSLKRDVSAGYDDIKVIPVKYVCTAMCGVWSYIINLMLSTGVFPDK